MLTRFRALLRCSLKLATLGSVRQGNSLFRIVGVHHAFVVAKPDKFICPRVLEQFEVVVYFNYDSGFVFDGLLALSFDFLQSLLLLLDQVHLEQIVFLKLLQEVHQVVLLNLNILLIV